MKTKSKRGNGKCTLNLEEFCLRLLSSSFELEADGFRLKSFSTAPNNLPMLSGESHMKPISVEKEHTRLMVVERKQKFPEQHNSFESFFPKSLVLSTNKKRNRVLKEEIYGMYHLATTCVETCGAFIEALPLLAKRGYRSFTYKGKELPFGDFEMMEIRVTTKFATYVTKECDMAVCMREGFPIDKRTGVYKRWPILVDRAIPVESLPQSTYISTCIEMMPNLGQPAVVRLPNGRTQDMLVDMLPHKVLRHKNYIVDLTGLQYGIWGPNKRIVGIYSSKKEFIGVFEQYFRQCEKKYENEDGFLNKCANQINFILEKTMENIEKPACSWCGSVKEVRRCQGCKNRYLCSRRCQLMDWGYHKNECKKKKKH